MHPPYRGSCLCGAVTFEIDEFLPELGHCHCSMCRKFHGAAFATLAGVKREHFRWLSGEETLQGYLADNGTTRRFCRQCGSSVTFASPRAPTDIVEIAIGLMDDPIPALPDAHIFVDSRASWTSLSDDLPKFRQGRGSAKVLK